MRRSTRDSGGSYPLEGEREVFTRAQVGDWRGFVEVCGQLQSRAFLAYGGNLELFRAHAYELEAILARAIARATGLEEPAVAAKEAGFGRLIEAKTAREIRAALEATSEDLAGILRAASYRVETAPVLERACRYLREHYADKITVEQVARAVNVNPQYLCRLFRRQLGLTLMDFLTEIRVKKAKDLLGRSPLRVGEIAARVGYRDASHFTKAFKQIEAMTPTEYRERH